MAKKKSSIEEAAVEVATAAYSVVTKLRHNGKTYKPKSSIDLDDDSAKRLLALGAVKAPAAPAAAAPAAEAEPAK